MKITVIFTILLTTVVSALGLPTQTDNTPEGGYLVIKEHTVDVGSISGDSIVSAFFTVYNKGSEAVSITNINSGCSCMIPHYSHEPIAPGDSVRFEVRYDPKGYKWGRFRRVLTIRSTATNKYISAVMSGTIRRKYVP